MEINLIEAYGIRVIGGKTKKDILSMDNDELYQELGCIYKYFNPPKSYYKFTAKDSCAKVFRAFNIDSTPYSGRCSRCFKYCFDSNMEIR